MIEPTTDDNAIDRFQTIRDLLDNIEDLHARGMHEGWMIGLMRLCSRLGGV